MAIVAGLVPYTVVRNDRGSTPVHSGTPSKKSRMTVAI